MISEKAIALSAIIFVISIAIFVWTFTLTWREYENLKCYRPRHAALFSERNGFSKGIRIGKWYFKLLR